MAVDGLVVWLRSQLDEDEDDIRQSRALWPDDLHWSMPSWLHRDRLLAEVATKRWLIDEIVGELGDDAEQQMVQLRLQHMALPYADRPGYDEAWRPEAAT
jgi:Family of unknown function (DUF6221)